MVSSFWFVASRSPRASAVPGLGVSRSTLRRRLGPIAGISAMLSLFAQQSQAQETHLAPAGNGDGMDSHLFRPAVDSKGFLYANGADVLPAQRVSFGLVVDYGRGLLPTRSTRTDRGANYLVQDSFQGTFGFTYGIAHRLAVGLQIPVVLMSANQGLNNIGPTGATYSTDQVSAQKLSGVALHAKLRVTDVDKGPGIALVAQAGVPVAQSPRDLASEPGVWFWPRVVLENRFFKQKFKIALDGGVRIHSGKGSRFGLDPAGVTQLEHGELEYTNLGTGGVALSYRVLPDLDLVAESYGSVLMGGASDKKQRFSQEYLGGIKLFMDEASYLTLGVGSRTYSTGFEAADIRAVIGIVFEPSVGDEDGDGIKDDQDKCPTVKEDRDGFEDEDGCPDPDNDKDGIPDVKDDCPNRAEDMDGDHDWDGCPEVSATDKDHDGILDIYDKCPNEREDFDGFQDKDGCPDLDNDQDGILDGDDKCPNVPEDKDGFEDKDGCPELDNDLDQIPDSEDKCPNKPETYNGYEDKDGCPDKGRVVVDGTDIVILDKVQFETNSAKILSESDAILDAVAATLKGHDEFQVVEIAGHADARGADQHNLQLTKARAEAVAQALEKRGISRARLVSQGYGKYCPLDTAMTPAAFDKNRRVEFKVVKMDKEASAVERGCEQATRAGVKPPPVK